MNIIVFGDSITYGSADWKSGGWVQLLKSRLEKQTDFDTLVYNLGISGNTSRDVLKRFESELKARIDAENIIIVEIGSNDSSYFDMNEKKTTVTEKEYEKNIKNMISIAKKNNWKILFLGIEPVIDSKLQPVPWNEKICYSNENCKRFNEILKNTCKKDKVPFLDLLSLLSNTKYLKHLNDGCHPDTKGHKIIFNFLIEFLKDEKVLQGN